MASYIVGMICGTVTLIFPLVYLMNYDRCVATVLQFQPRFNTGPFSLTYSATLASGVAAIGAVVLIISVAVMALSFLRQSRSQSS